MLVWLDCIFLMQYSCVESHKMHPVWLIVVSINQLILCVSTYYQNECIQQSRSSS